VSFFGSILGALGVGSNPTGYSFSQQDKDFIKLQFKYGLELKNKLAAGEITQDYYNNNFWLTTQTLEAPYNGWYDEFKTAIQSEDLNWLSAQVGETVESLTAYLGTALTAVTKAAGNLVGTAISSTSTGLVSGFVGSLNFFGWAAVIGIGVATYYGFKKGYIQKAFKVAAL
jgi:hypothetical protein